jgi:hypothetical protein
MLRTLPLATVLEAAVAMPAIAEDTKSLPAAPPTATATQPACMMLTRPAAMPKVQK